MQDNPLLSIPFAFPFHRVRAEHIQPAVRELMERAEQQLAQIESQTAQPSYATTLAALEAATDPLERAMGLIGHIESVASAPALRDAHDAVRPEVSAFYASIPLRPGLWGVLRRYADSDEARSLPSAKARFLEKTLDDFRRNGAELDEAGKARLQQISRELATVSSKFSQNVLDETAAFELLLDDGARLEGLPASALEAARLDAQRHGKDGYRFTLQAPSLIAVLTYASDRQLRETMWRAYNTRAATGERSNVELIERLLDLRRERAQLLGYPNFAALVLEDRMARTPEAALAFVSSLTSRAQAAFTRETEELQSFAQHEAQQVGPLQPWDIAYYAEAQRRARYDLDQETLRAYFPLSSVIDGLFTIAKRLYSIDIRPNSKLPKWHEDVRVYDLLDHDGTHLASFYMDLHPREEKRGGAWMNSLISGVHDGQRLEPHLGLICTNVTRPLPGQPALLTHDEVCTLFHEFGHLLHHCLSAVDVRALVGTNVAWDFVELPSQIFENWCWERPALNAFAAHYQTQAGIPPDLLTKLQRARTYRAASAMMRQLGFASVDLALHVEYEASTNGSVLEFARRQMQRFSPAPYPADFAMLASFSHLFSSPVGYAAGYYSYKWAEVLDADAFTRFQREGIFNPVTGEQFRRTILERGDSAEPMQLYRDFMGREPELEPLLRRCGLETGSDQAA